MYYYIGPYQLLDRLDAKEWGIPGSNGSLSLTSESTEVKDKNYNGVGLFWTESPISEIDYLFLGDGDCREIRPSGKTRKSWETYLKYKPDGDTLSEWIADHLMFGSDPNRELSVRSLVPTLDNDLEVYIHNTKIYSEKFDWSHKYKNKFKDVLRLQLKEYKKQCKADKAINPKTNSIDKEWHRKCAKAICETYKIDWTNLKPQDWDDDETPLDHDTVIQDSFTNTNGTLLSAHSAGGFSWGMGAANYSIQSNQLRCNLGSSVYGRAESDLSTANNYSQVRLKAFLTGYYNQQIGPTTRYTSSTSSGYMARAIFYFSPHQAYLSVASYAGDPTANITNIACPFSLNDVVKITSNGSTHTFYQNDVSICSGTDTTYSTGTRCGFFTYYGSVPEVELDDFEAGDGLGGGGGGGSGPILRNFTINESFLRSTCQNLFR